jgi:hypothetical protein
MMSEHAWSVLGAVASLLVLGVLALGALALWLGRPVRAQGRARFGEKHEFAVAVEVPGIGVPERHTSGSLPPPLLTKQ